MSRYQVRVINSLAEFRTIGDQWNRLVEATPLDHAYMRHEWFSCWIEAYNAGDHLAVVTLWQGDSLVAAAPLRRAVESKRGISIRLLKFLQSPVSPRCNIISTTPDQMQQIIQAMYTLPDWDLLILENLEESMPSTQQLAGLIATEKDIRGRITEGRQSPFMSITGTWDDYLTSLNSARRGYIKNECMKRLTKAKSHSLYRLHAAQDAENVFVVMHDVSGRSWKGAEGSAIGQLSAMQTFYELYLPIALRLGHIDVWVLEIESIIAGFDCCLTNGNNYSGIRSDYDTQLKYYHPGENMRIAVIRRLFDSGKPGEYDMGGDAALYKMKWATGIRRHLNITIVNDTWRAKGIAFSRYTLKPIIERIMKRTDSAPPTGGNPPPQQGNTA
ncbi:MAG: GNAT family N-acetyltransferase [Candidatus Zixiibacteriota bacterium]